MEPQVEKPEEIEGELAIHQRLAEEEERDRFTAFLTAGAVGSFVLSIAVWLAYGWQAGAIGVVLGILQLIARHYGCQTSSNIRLRWLREIVLCGYLVVIVVLALFTGQSQSFVLWFLVLLPVMGAFVNNPPTAGLWASLATLAALGVWASDYWFVMPQRWITTPDLRAFTRIVLILSVAMISIRVRHTSDRRIQELSRSLHQEMQLKRSAENLQHAADQARRAAETASRAKSRVLAFMSHELRTPLNGVIGLNSLLEETPLTDQQRRYVELSKNSGEILLSLINDFLDFSKLEADRLVLEPLVFSPCRLVEERVLILKEGARQKGLQLSCECTAPGCVRGDETRVGQILLNLLGNAIKFTSQGGVVLRCLKKEEIGNKIWLRFEVEDSGIGIPEEMQQHLFQPFVQADVSTTRKYGGTGLGLAICKSLTEVMGGRIGVTSTVGRGSLFWVELPFAAVRPEERLPDPAQEPDIPALPAGSAGRVLVAEDNPVNQLMASEMLRRLGYSVEMAANGSEAVEVVRHRPVDLVLMDCDMPVMDGLEATRAIRLEEPEGRRLPIVAMTASVLQGDKERCLEAGMDDYLAKPFRLVDLDRMARKWTGGKAEAAPGPAGAKRAN